MGNCNFTPTLFNLLSFRLGPWHSSYFVLYLLLQYGNLLVSQFLRWACMDYGVRISTSTLYSVSFSSRSLSRRLLVNSCIRSRSVRTYIICTYHHCCDDPRGAAAFSALHLAARRSVSGTMGSCRDFCACTILQSSCCLGAIIMAALRCTEIHWTWKRLKTRAIMARNRMLSSVT